MIGNEKLEDKLKGVFEKYRKEYVSACSPTNGLEPKRDDALKFDPINSRFIAEILDEINDYMKQNPYSDRKENTMIGQKYIKDFQKLLFDPFC